MIGTDAFDANIIKYEKCTIEEFRAYPYVANLVLDIKDDDGNECRQETKTFAEDSDWYLSERDAKIIYKHLVDASWDADLVIDCISYNGNVATLIVDGNYIPVSCYGAFCAVYDIGRKAKENGINN